ncbi:hypothetical protein [Candidatus Williamhamiltonella defendens]|uniref:hypothetical protein n=1 Tax=Candidatus Williamhamiltonella defendens TaxID=138072 RepID=UPI00130DD8F6|nr:hypothetical protein [Candidatus Hamiltonella defensa]
MAAIAIVVRKLHESVEAFSLDEAITLATLLFEVNIDFFVQRVAPTLQQDDVRINVQINDCLAGILSSNG